VIKASRGRAAILLLLTFAAGLAVGLAAERHMLHRGTGQAERHSERAGRTTIERFASDLGITPAQQAQIDPILVDTRSRMSEVFDRVRPEWELVVDSARARIEAVLTPEQVEKYRALLEEQEREHDDAAAESDTSDGNPG